MYTAAATEEPSAVAEEHSDLAEEKFWPFVKKLSAQWMICILRQRNPLFGKDYELSAGAEELSAATEELVVPEVELYAGAEELAALAGEALCWLNCLKIRCPTGASPQEKNLHENLC